MDSYAIKLRRRLFLCTAFAVLVAGTAYFCAWRSVSPGHASYMGTAQTFQELNELRDALEKYWQANGRYPEELADLKELKPEQFWVNEDGEWNDPWRSPYQYKSDGDGFVLFSFGRDRKPGGIGLDADLYGKDRREGYPTFTQFRYEMHGSGEMKVACVFAGICAFILGYMLGIGKQGSSLVLMKIGLTTAACIVTAIVIGGVHMISGH